MYACKLQKYGTVYEPNEKIQNIWFVSKVKLIIIRFEN